MKQKKYLYLLMLLVVLGAIPSGLMAQQRRPIDNLHPLWLIHVDVWNKADPQKIINLIPDKVKPYVCMNLSLSCQYDTEKNVYKMPQNAVKTYKSWASVCQANGMWFSCQPASGGHTHIQDNDLETFEYFFKKYPNFLGWNYAEQFWGFDEPGDKSSSPQTTRLELFANLVKMSHQYGGMLTVSFCGNIWSHGLNPLGMMKRNRNLYQACQAYPEAILWLYKYTTSSCFYNNESVTFGPFVSGLAANYGVRYDNCGWNGALGALYGDDNKHTYPVAAGLGTVIEQTCVNGGAVWDGPELIWTEDFKNLSNTTVNGYTQRNWGTFPGFGNAWLDLFEKIIDGKLRIPTREEVVQRTKVIVVNDVNTSDNEASYAAWGDLYDGLYKQTDPFNRGNGQWMDNMCYFKKTGRYGAIPVTIGLNDSLSKTIPVQVKKSARNTRWSTSAKKVAEFNREYPEVSKGDLYVSRYKNQLVTYTPYTYANAHTTATALIPLQYNTCDSLTLTWGKLSSGVVHEYPDHIDVYLNNYRTDTVKTQTDRIIIQGATIEPVCTITKHGSINATFSKVWDEASGLFTVDVLHNGPVDLSIQCSGTHTDRSTDTLSVEALPMPKQPDPFRGEIVIEAEDMNYKYIKSCVTDPYGWYPNVRGHSGNGFMDMGSNTAGALLHYLTTPNAGKYQLAIRYTNTNKDASIIVTVNGTRKTLRCSKTNVNEWRKVSMDCDIKEGKNTLLITNTGGAAMYIDNVTYIPEGTPAELYSIKLQESEGGDATLSTNEAAEGDTVYITAQNSEEYRFVKWNVERGNVLVRDDSWFVMGDENVVLKPVFESTTEVYALNFESVTGGTLPQGWECMQENSTLHAYPNSFSQGARTFSGFGGYQKSALYWRENYAEYGAQANYRLSLESNSYILTYAMAAWKSQPKYKVQILAEDNTIVAQGAVLLALPNANGSQQADLSSATLNTLKFDVTTPGNYRIRFCSQDAVSGYDEFLLLECKVKIDLTSGIEETEVDESAEGPIYNLNGQRVDKYYKGFVIKNHKKYFVR